MNQPLAKHEFILNLMLEPGQELPQRITANSEMSSLLHAWLRKALELGGIVGEAAQ